VYFGKTTNVKYRWWQHENFAKRGSELPFHRALRKYGKGAFNWEVVGTFPDDLTASIEERRLIAQTERGQGYNVAKGGDGGHTMSEGQLDAQYGIPASKASEFSQLFLSGLSAPRIAEHFGVGWRAVKSCAQRLGLSFSVRKKSKGLRVKRQSPKKPKLYRYVSRAKYTPEERRKIRTESNKSRSSSEVIKDLALALYFEESLSAQEVADRLGIPRATVRGVVNRAYAAMPAEKRQALKKKRGSEVRRGERNSNSHARRR
jgi:hypothetical protein